MERGKEVNLTFTDGRGFYPVASEGDRFLRLPFCALTTDEISEGIKRLSSIV
jgi:2-aminoadipate transaminase